MTIDAINSFSLSVAIMVLFFILEYFVSLATRKKVFQFSDTITNTACGIIERGIFVLFAFIYYGAFELVYNNFRLFTIPKNWLTTAVLFIAVDLLWYCYHRAGHVINVFWAAHITHHQSEQYNLTLSFRVSSLQLFIRMFFWMILPLLGFDPWTTTFIIGINAAYQFFIHTRLINKLGFIEHIFVTPSHHRVHHGKNAQYIDKNYGGIFIIWDKLFGTFEEEKEEVHYGITKPLNSNNPFYAWFHYYIDLYRASKMVHGFKNKVKLWLDGPEKLAFYYDSLPKEEYELRDLNNNIKWYIGTQFSFLCAICVGMFYYYGKPLTNNEILVLIFYVAFASWSISSVLEFRPISFYMEFFRIVFTVLVIIMMATWFNNKIYYYCAAAYLLIFMPWLWIKRSHFLAAEKLKV